MEVLVPIAITAAMLTSSTAAEPGPGETAWNAATTYAVGDIVVRTTTHRRYKSAFAGVDATPPESAPTKWQDDGPTNRLAAFDREVSTPTEVTSPLTMVLQPGVFFNAMDFYGLQGTGFHAVVKDAPGGNVIKDVVDTLEASDRGDWYDYWFAPFKPKTGLVISDIEPFATAEITITITNGGGTAKCGMMNVGDLRQMGETLRDPPPKAKPVSDSYVGTNSANENVIKRGKSAKDIAATVYIKVDDANSVVDTFEELLGVPCSYIFSREDRLRALRTFGLGAAEISYTDPGSCRANVTVEGVIS